MVTLRQRLIKYKTRLLDWQDFREDVGRAKHGHKFRDNPWTRAMFPEAFEYQCNHNVDGELKPEIDIRPSSEASYLEARQSRADNTGSLVDAMWGASAYTA